MRVWNEVPAGSDAIPAMHGNVIVDRSAPVIRCFEDAYGRIIRKRVGNRYDENGFRDACYDRVDRSEQDALYDMLESTLPR
jgi:hypothetical protein